MHTKTKYYLLLITINLFCGVNIYAQVSNYIYALNNASSGVFYFSRIEISTGAISNYQVATNILSNNYSACISEQENKYFLCTGKIIKSFDAITGTLSSTYSLPIASTANFIHTQFNPCDSGIYGIINDYPSITFAKYNRSDNSMTVISSLGSITDFCMGCMSILDPVSGIFTFDNGNIIGLSLSTGQILYNSPIVNLPNETFHHIALKCSTHEIFGTSANVGEGVKFLSTINPYTGVVTHVSEHGWSSGIIKPASGGDCINQLTNDFYYSGAGHLLIGANTVSGNLISNLTINSGELYFVQHFSECACISTTIDENEDSKNEIALAPNPFTTTLNIIAEPNKEYQILIYDIIGNNIFQEKCIGSTSLNKEHLQSGIYILEVRDKTRILKRVKVVKQ